MKTIGMFLFLFFLGISPVLPQVIDQGYYSISGVVRDARSRQPIAFASIFVPGASIGTVTNLDGAFTLKVQKLLNATHFVVSHIGYHSLRLSISEQVGTGRVFFLEPHSVTLPEFVVRPDNPRELVRLAISRIPHNYPSQAQRLTGFYREAIKQRREYVSIAEAVVDIDQTAYSSRAARDRVKIVQARKSGDVKRMDTLVVKLQGGPHVAMLLDVVKNPNVILDAEILEYYHYEFQDVVIIDGRTNYVIGFRPAVILDYPLYKGRLFIDVQDMGFSMAEFSLDLSNIEKAAASFIVRKPPRLRFTPTRTNYLVTYKRIDEQYFLNYVRSEMEFFADWRRRIFRTSYTVMSEMAITERIPEASGRFALRDVFRPSFILSDMVMSYFDQAFWGDYNVIEPDESIESAIQRFNRRFE